MEKEIYLFEMELMQTDRNKVICLPLQVTYNLQDVDNGNYPNGEYAVGIGELDLIEDQVTIEKWEKANIDYLDSQLSAMLFLLM